MKIFISSVIFITLLLTNAYGESAKNEMDIKRDKEKTVYIIGSPDSTKEKDTTEEDRKNSWDMLKNANIRIDKR
ncbi:MAG TPA: hypothetical protein PKZ54_02695 [Syntrophorhabdaceae bacterium]|nr:hypothetical protein [Syntrophorhabdaceae bacterium]